MENKEEMKEMETVKYFEISGERDIPANKFQYSLPDIQLENISEGIHDEYLLTAITNPENLQEITRNENEQILYDLALLENISELKSQ